MTDGAVKVCDGGAGGGLDPPAEIAAEGADVAAVEPFLFVATTRTRSVSPPRLDATTYVLAVAPETGAQLPPLVSQWSHWKLYVMFFPDHVPVEALIAEPTCGVPLIVGTAIFSGGCCPGGPPADAAVAKTAARKRAGMRTGRRLIPCTCSASTPRL